jgi:hypothetical protein
MTSTGWICEYLLVCFNFGRLYVDVIRSSETKLWLPGLVASFDPIKHAACSQGVSRDRVTLDETDERPLARGCTKKG